MPTKDQLPNDQPPADDPDKAVLKGGPGEEDPDAAGGEDAPDKTKSDQPASSRIRYRDRELEVPSDAAEAWEAREKEFQRKLSQQGTELGELRQAVTRLGQGGDRPKPQEPDIEALLFTEPRKALDLHGQRILAAVEAKQQRQERIQEFWDGFYKDNPDLEGAEVIAESLMARNFAKLANLSVAEAAEELANSVRKVVIKLTGDKSLNKGEVKKSGRAIVEGASGERKGKASEDDDDDEPKSLTEVIKARKAARQKTDTKKK